MTPSEFQLVIDKQIKLCKNTLTKLEEGLI